MTTADLLRSLAEKDERIAELQAEILELKIESHKEPIQVAQDLIDECRDDDGNVDFEKLSDVANEYAEVNQYLTIYSLFHDIEEECDEEDE